MKSTLPTLVFAVLYLLSATPGYAQFQKIFGSGAHNYFHKIIPDGPDYYALGIDGNKATVTRISSTGQYQWTRNLNLSSNFTDAALIPGSGGNLMVVGYTLPFDNSNKSVLGIVTPAGAIQAMAFYDAPGREGFTDIEYNALSGSFSVLGFQTDVPNSLNEVVLLNVSFNGAITSKKIFSSPGNDGFEQDLEILPNGDFIVAGYAGNYGVIYQMSSAGALVSGVLEFSSFLFEDVAQTANGDFLAAGRPFGSGLPRLTRFDAGWLPVWEVTVVGLDYVDQIVEAANGDIYAIGTGNFNGLDRAVILNIKDNGGLPFIASAKYIENGETAYLGGSIALLPNGNIAFADSRVGNQNGLGGYDAFLAVTNGDLTSNCAVDAPIGLDTFASVYAGPDGIDLLSYNVPAAQAFMASHTDWQEADACSGASLFECGMAITTYQPKSYNLAEKVLSVRDVRDRTGVPKLTNWLAPEITHPLWTYGNLGSIFGIATDKFNNIYVCATNAYVDTWPNTNFYGPAGSGGIYRIDAVTGNPTSFVKTGPAVIGQSYLPNNLAGLGNICYDEAHDQLFVTNLEDGMIYRIDAFTGNVLSAFDPFAPDDGIPGLACEGERIWGIGLLRNRVYFSQCNQNFSHNGLGPNKIYSVAIDPATGDFAGTEILEITLPPYQITFQRSSPVSDIEFSADGKMIVAEHSDFATNSCESGVYYHQSKVLEFVGGHLSWSLSPRNFFVGNHSLHTNSAGGVDYGYQNFDPASGAIGKCDSMVWVSGDALVISATELVYGIAGIPASGNTFSMLKSWYVDDDMNINTPQKAHIGDVDIIHCGCPAEPGFCDSIVVVSTSSPIANDSCCFNLTVDNMKPEFFTGIALSTRNGTSISSVSAQNDWTISAYSGAKVSLEPPGGTFIFPVNQAFVKVCLSGSQDLPGQEVSVHFLGPGFEVVCQDTLILPCSQEPKCLKITDATVVCANNGPYQLDFCLMADALIGWNVSSFTLNPPPGVTFTPSTFTVDPALLQGQVRCAFSTLVSGGSDGGSICFSLTAYEQDIDNQQMPLAACTDLENPVCLHLPVCVCDQVSAAAQSVPTPGDGCCWKINLTNNYGNSFFSGIRVDILTPEVVFGAINNPAGSGWSPSSTPTQSVFNKMSSGSGFLGSAEVLPEFCLSGLFTQAQVVLYWLGPNGEVICADSLILNCDVPMYAPCAELLNPVISCGPGAGAYNFQFQVKNTGGFSANTVAMDLVTPGSSSILTTRFAIPPLAGDSTTFTIATTVFGESGSEVCFNLRLLELDADSSELNSCTIGYPYCLPVPYCEACCVDYDAFSNWLTNNFHPTHQFADCYAGVNGTGLNNCMQITWDWGDGSPDSGPYPNNTPVSHNYALPGLYVVCWTIEEMNSNGDACWSNTACFDVRVNCDQSGYPCPNNLVPNSSFESYTACPTGISQLNLAAPWTTPTAGTTDYYNNCGPAVIGTPTNSSGSQVPRTGNAYAGVILVTGFSSNSREYLEVPLSAPLLGGHTYNVSFYVNLADKWRWGIDRIGAYLSIGSIGFTPNNTPLPFVPQISNPLNNFITDKANWTLISGTFTSPTGLEDHLVIGNFYNDNLTIPVSLTGPYQGAYYYIDDVSICEDCDDPPCRPVCPCDNIPQFHADVDKGFLPLQLYGQCKYCFIPKALTSCDKVEWSINGILQPTTTTGNQAFCYTFPQSGGTYTITMNVIRTKWVNQICDVYQFQKTITVNCSILPDCSKPKVYNPGFDTLAVSGVLGMGGNSAHWSRVAGTPRVDSIPSNTEGWVITLSGNSDSYDAIRTDEEICLKKDSGTINVLLRSVDANGSPATPKPGERLVVQFVRGDNFLPGACAAPDCYEVANVLLPEDLNDWANLNIDYNLSSVAISDNCGTVPSLRIRPVIYVTNTQSSQDPDTRSQLQLDNFCLEGPGNVVGTSVLPGKSAIRIFPNPNPGAFSVDLSEPAPAGLRFRIIGITGQLLLEQPAQPGVAMQTVGSGDLPGGLYFLQVVLEGKMLAVEKFVKQ